ncbi:MAG TPA: flagellar basal body rod protein FlgC [Dissulfurispiraceae bacterium]|nr:flagellar basal body rod protein FlgC [Dissulfurispiraceae bacterium]
MDAFSIFKVSSSALEAQRRRMNVIASNMANVHSTRTEEGGPYRRKDVVFSPVSYSPGDSLQTGVKVDDVVTDMNTAFRTVHDPSHPDADADGNVAMPNINVIEEMVNMMMASRAYEASVTAFNTAKSMVLKTLELGRS